MDEGTDRGAARLDAFVDAAFAFAVTLLVISGRPPQTIDELLTALQHVPAFAAAFALLLVFWGAHRGYARLAPRRDALSTVLGLAVVFVVLVYVYPLRLLTEGMLHFLSGGRLDASIRLNSFGDLATLYAVYGIGSAVLSFLFVGLFAHALSAKERVGLTDAQEARESVMDWAIVGAAGLLSAGLAATPLLPHAPWLPGFAYWVIPAGIAVRMMLTRGARRREAPENAA